MAASPRPRPKTGPKKRTSRASKSGTSGTSGKSAKSGASGKSGAGGSRVPHEERRKQLLAVAARLLTSGGVEHVQMTELAERAGVSRPLVYRLFPTRQAIVRAMMEDLGAELSHRFQEALVRVMPGTVDAIARAFVDACCDAIEHRGAGPWRLLDGSGGDPELARIGRATLRHVLEPWEVRLGELTGRSARRSAWLMWTIVQGGRAALDGWIDGGLSRKEAVEDATRAVTALLMAFAEAPGPVEVTPEQVAIPSGPAPSSRRGARRSR